MSERIDLRRDWEHPYKRFEDEQKTVEGLGRTEESPGEGRGRGKGKEIEGDLMSEAVEMTTSLIPHV